MSMENEGGFRFEIPADEPKSPEKPADKQLEKAVEQQKPAKHEAGVAKNAPQPGSTAVDDALQDQPPLDVTSDKNDQAKPAAPISPLTKDLKAEEADLIEKQWIDKAKTIVEKTRSDPHLQKDQMSRIKADYIQKRYKKIIKTDEATA